MANVSKISDTLDAVVCRGLTQREYADQSGITTQAVKMRLYRARQSGRHIPDLRRNISTPKTFPLQHWD